MEKSTPLTARGPALGSRRSPLITREVGGGAGPSEGQRPATAAGAGPGPSQGDAGAAMLAAAGSTLQAARLLLLQRVPRAVPRPLGPPPSPRWEEPA